MTSDLLFTAPQTMRGQLAMNTDELTAATADAHVAAAPNMATALDRLEQALAAGVPIADLLAVQGERII